jgi:hypothetical protein
MPYIDLRHVMKVVIAVCDREPYVADDPLMD